MYGSQTPIHEGMSLVTALFLSSLLSVHGVQGALELSLSLELSLELSLSLSLWSSLKYPSPLLKLIFLLQLILPECMKLLPLYMNSLIKCDILAGGRCCV